jgi:hypothetical protein
VGRLGHRLGADADQPDGAGAVIKKNPGQLELPGVAGVDGLTQGGNGDPRIVSDDFTSRVLKWTQAPV